ncbi:hypothetical protein ACJX0J_020855, partial [Zea mays]
NKNPLKKYVHLGFTVNYKGNVFFGNLANFFFNVTCIYGCGCTGNILLGGGV